MRIFGSNVLSIFFYLTLNSTPFANPYGITGDLASGTLYIPDVGYGSLTAVQLPQLTPTVLFTQSDDFPGKFVFVFLITMRLLTSII